jgi:hypothetical protein
LNVSFQTPESHDIQVALRARQVSWSQDSDPVKIGLDGFILVIYSSPMSWLGIFSKKWASIVLNGI